jgi:hypothetical protein
MGGLDFSEAIFCAARAEATRAAIRRAGQGKPTHRGGKPQAKP